MKTGSFLLQKALKICIFSKKKFINLVTFLLFAYYKGENEQ